MGLAGLRCCGRPAISKGLLKLGRDLARENVEQLLPYVRQGVPILGCEPSCLVTLVDEYRDFRLGPAADEVARACSLVEAFVADPATRPGPGLQAAGGAGLAPWALPAEGGGRDGGDGGGPQADSGPRGQGARLRLLRHGRLVRLRARPLRRQHGPGQPRDPPGRGRRSRARLVAPGFSCRSQVHGLAGINAVHPIQLLAERLDKEEIAKVEIDSKGAPWIPCTREVVCGFLPRPSIFEKLRKGVGRMNMDTKSQAVLEAALALPRPNERRSLPNCWQRWDPRTPRLPMMSWRPSWSGGWKSAGETPPRQSRGRC